MSKRIFDLHEATSCIITRNTLMQKALEHLFGGALGVKDDEHVAFIYDSTFRDLADPVRQFSESTRIRVSTLEIEYDGIAPMSAAVRELLAGQQHKVIVFGLVHNIWHTPERKEAKYRLRKRLASLVCSPEDFLIGAVVSDIEKIAKMTRKLSSFFRKDMRFRATTPNGTDFEAIVGIPFCEDGLYHQPGTGGDFPSGEVGFGPAEGSVNGRIVYDLKVQHVGLLDSPLVLEVKNDRIVHIEGTSKDQFLGVCRNRGEILQYISEISLGMNPGGILTPSSQFIPEEKNYGTLHCGHGGNASYGNRIGPHLDGVMDRPTVFLDDLPLMKDGQLNDTHVDDDLLVWLHSAKCQ